jgi:WD40 repeat protein
MQATPPPTPTQPGPFISYAREDQAFVRRLYDALLARGRDAWVDWEIFPSADWMVEIRSAIDAAPVYVFVISPDSIASEVCGQELAHAVAQNKRLIPLVCRHVEPERVAEPLRKLNWIFALDDAALDAQVGPLIDVMDADLAWVRAHARLLVRAQDWLDKDRNPGLLLRGGELKDAEHWLARLGSERMPQATAAQTQFVMASRRAQVRRQRVLLAGVSVALVLTAALAVYALVQSRIAEHQRNVALSRLLAAQSLKAGSSDLAGTLDLALLLGVAALRIEPTLEARASLLAALTEAGRMQRFVPTTDTLVSLALSPDGRRIATGDFHGAIVLWDTRTLDATATLRQGTGAVQALAFSPDGATLAAAGSGRTVLWDVAAARERQVLQGGHRDTSRLVWHPSGATLFSASRNEPQVMVWDAATGTQRGTLASDRTIALAISPDGSTLATAANRSREVVLWNPADRSRLAVLQGHDGPVRTLAFSRDGALLASAGEDATIRVWDVAAAALRTKLEGQPDRIETVAFSPDGMQLASGSNNRTIMLWDMARGRPQELLRGHSNSLMNVAYSADGATLVSNAFGSSFIVWNLGLPQQRAVLRGHQSDVRAVAVSADGATVASGGDDRTVRLWDVGSGRQRTVSTEHRGALRALAFSADGGVLASASDDDRRILLWDASAGRTLKEVSVDGDLISLALSPDGKLLAAGTEAGSAVMLWNLATDAAPIELRGHDGSVTALAFTRDGSRLVSGGRDGALRVWDVATRRPVGEPIGAGGAVSALALSPDGTALASSAHMTESVLLHDLAGARGPIELDTHGSHGGNRIAFRPDGKLLAYTAGELRASVVLWGVADAKPLVTLDGTATILSLAFTPDGKRLVTGHAGGTLTLWDVDTDRWPARACEVAHRNLTRDEWKAGVGADLPYAAVCPGLPVPAR